VDTDGADDDQRAATSKMPRAARRPALERATFTTSRALDFFSVKGLTTQTGHGVEEWPLVILKELADNALDACEEAGTAPEIRVTVDSDGMTVSDNGPGLPPSTVAKVLDYRVRVSSREAYVAPDRGAQGNALKTIMAMPFVLHGEEGHVTVIAQGVRHEITVRLDQVRQEPVISHVRQPADARTGTQVTVHWPESASSIMEAARPRFLQVAQNYAWLNPHLAITVDWDDDREVDELATLTGWPKWKPSDQTCPHWYTRQKMGRLIAAHVGDPAYAGMSVGTFVRQFRGLTSSAKGKLVLAETGLARTDLASLANERLDLATIAVLLESMRRHSQPVKPAQLGVIGRDHLAMCMAGEEAEMGSFHYKKAEGTDSSGQPYVIEAVFAWVPLVGERRLIMGINWSPALGNPFRQLGMRGRSLGEVLAEQRVIDDCILVIHLARPGIYHTDQGKSAVELPADLGDCIIGVVESVTAKWAKQRKAEERHANAALNRRNSLTRTRSIKFTEAMEAVMPVAYLEASSGGRFTPAARQVMYKARPGLLEITGQDALDSEYFTQTLLPNYIAKHGLEGEWKIAYDARGHFTEPHGSRPSGAVTRVALGTLEVREYIGQRAGDPLAIGKLPLDYPTAGPQNRYGGVVFIEKEGFDQQIAESGLAAKHDVAFMSTKGVSTTACRELVDYLAGQGTRIFIVRDFDRAGFTIAGTLATSSRRYRFANQADVTDLGLRLEDVEEYGLDDEPWREKISRDSAERALRRHGATEAEIGFLIDGGDRQYTWGRRVELNAFTTAQFIEWLDAKLEEHGTGKVIPDARTLETAYRRARIRHAVNKKIDEVAASLRDQATTETVPGDLEEQIRQRLDDEPRLSWDEALAIIAVRGN
jgi:hypothetical protein